MLNKRRMRIRFDHKRETETWTTSEFWALLSSELSLIAPADQKMERRKDYDCCERAIKQRGSPELEYHP